MSLPDQRGSEIPDGLPLSGAPEKAEPLFAAAPPISPSLRELARQLRLERRQAADPEELAAILEEEGYSDEVLRGRYTLGGLFDTAEQLYALRIGPRQATSLLGLAAPPWRWLWRGPLLLLVGGSALSSAQLLGSREALSALAAAGVVAWGTGLRLAWLRQVSRLAPARLRPRLLSGVLLGGVLGALATLALSQATSQTPALLSALVGGVLGGLYSAALISAGLLLVLARWPFVGAVFGAVLALALLLRSAGLVGGVWGAALLLALVGASLGAAFLATREGAERAVRRLPDAALAAALPLPPGARWAELQNRFSGASAWPLVGYGWACALVFVALAWRVGSGVLVLPLLLFGVLEWLSALMQARLRQLAQLHQDPARLRRGALWPAFGAPLFLLLLSGLLGHLFRWTGLIAAETLSVHLWGAALLNAGLLQSAWLARQPRQWPRLAALWLLGAGLLSTSLVNWWVPLLLLSLILILLCDDALNDLSTYR